jgi:hypothetical protein
MMWLHAHEYLWDVVRFFQGDPVYAIENGRRPACPFLAQVINAMSDK